MSKIKLFESKQIRSVWNEADQKWYFAVVDVVEALTDSSDPKQYIKKTRQNLFSFVSCCFLTVRAIAQPFLRRCS